MTTAIISKEQQSQLDSALFKKLQQLTMKMPNDPNLYKQDVQKYSKMYQQQFIKLLSDIQRKNQKFAQLLIFLSRCVKYFTKNLSYVPTQVIDLLKNHGPNLHPYVRKKCVGSIMILRAKNILYPVQTIQFLLTLFNIQDKQLRKILYKYLLNDIRRMNKHHKNIKINQQIRNFMYQSITKNADKMSQKSLQMMIDLYKRNIWTDNRSVNIISQGCFSQSPKIRMIAAHFLISTTQPLQQLQDSDQDQAVNLSQIKFKKGITKHTNKKQKQVEKQKKRAQKRLRKKQIQGRKHNFMPIDIIYNPQDFAQKLFNFMLKKNIKFIHKLVYMSLISRLIWRHKLIILPWYGSLIKYLQPKQKQVHKILTYFAESIHQNLPDDQIQTVIKHIIQKFINDRCTQFSMTIGLNTIRQVYTKMNSIINQDIMLYLASYYDYKNKNVRMAAKSLINLVRDINPYLLQKKYRGRNINQSINISKIGKDTVKTTIEGAQLLQHHGNLPIYMDRILTDQDFKQIRRLKRKQQQERQMRQLEQEEQQDDEEGEDQDQDEQDQEDGQQQQDQQNEGEQLEENSQQGQDDGQQIDWEDCQELEQLVEGEQQQQEGQEQQMQQQEDGEGVQQQDGQQQQMSGEEQQQQQQSQMQDQSEQVNKKLTKAQKRQIKKKQNENAKKVEEQRSKTQIKSNKSANKKKQVVSSQSEYQSEQSQENPHGFISVDQIAHYKKSKTEIKAERKRNGEKKQKFKHTPKDKKGGGTTNKEKQKLKPLMMLRAKKNRIRSQQKQVKLRIKNLKNQLGRVRSGKQAKKLKNKRIVKKAKR